jgi:hypothetical protein
VDHKLGKLTRGVGWVPGYIEESGEDAETTVEEENMFVT